MVAISLLHKKNMRVPITGAADEIDRGLGHSRLEERKDEEESILENEEK